jgi:DNA-binding NarL/FixJ family response regulator
MATKSVRNVEKAKTEILIVDDHALFREGLAMIIKEEKDLAVCGDCEDAVMALKKAQATKPDLAIVDISLEGTNGIELTKRLRAAFPQMRILIVSMHKELLYAERALRAGANGYVMKHRTSRELIGAIRAVIKGETYVSDTLREHILRNVGVPLSERASPVSRLSNREFEVFELIARGYSARHMAAALHMSTKTVETHREHIREKLHIKTSFELIQYAHDWATSEKSG